MSFLKFSLPVIAEKVPIRLGQLFGRRIGRPSKGKKSCSSAGCGKNVLSRLLKTNLIRRLAAPELGDGGRPREGANPPSFAEPTEGKQSAEFSRRDAESAEMAFSLCALRASARDFSAFNPWPLSSFPVDIPDLKPIFHTYVHRNAQHRRRWPSFPNGSCPHALPCFFHHSTFKILNSTGGNLPISLFKIQNSKFPLQSGSIKVNQGKKQMNIVPNPQMRQVCPPAIGRKQSFSEEN